MEHRRFKRNTFHFTVKLITNNQQVYQAQVLDISPMGVRILNEKPLPPRIKVVEVEVSNSTDSQAPILRMPMFVVHRDDKDGLVMGLCLLHEGDRIKFKRYWQHVHTSNARQ